jgi:hypothetical protein
VNHDHGGTRGLDRGTGVHDTLTGMRLHWRKSPVSSER